MMQSTIQSNLCFKMLSYLLFFFHNFMKLIIIYGLFGWFEIMQTNKIIDLTILF